jgi:Glycosyl transferase family 2/HPr Serine kinase C-terminal domain
VNSERPAESLMSDAPERPESEQRAFYEAVMERSLLAASRTRSREYHLTLAGARIRLLFASETLERHFLPALSHLLSSPADKPDATFHVWDSASTGVEMIPSPFGQTCFTDRGDIWGFSSPRFRSAFHLGDCSLNVMDMMTGQGAFWVNAAEQLPYWTKAMPLRTLLHWLMMQRGCQLLHGAAVGVENAGVLILGKGGAGKSTTALACLSAGMPYVADDYVVVQLEPTPRAHSLYATAKLEPRQLAHFPNLRGLATPFESGETEKAVLDLSKSGTYRVTPSLPLVAVMSPRFGDGVDTTVRPASPSLVYNSAAFTTTAQLPHAGRETHEFIARMLETLPGFELVLGREIARVPSAIADFVSKPLPAATNTHEERGKTAGRGPVSVIIPAYNGAAFLRDAIRSVIEQNYEPLDVVIVDDGSTDDLSGVVDTLPIDVRLLRQANAGPAAARNHGIRNATGDYIAFLDVDDLWPKDTLATLAARLADHPEIDVVHGHGQLIKDGASDHAFDFVGSAHETFPYYVGAGLYRRRAFERAGLFDEELRFNEDTDWFVRAREAGLAIEKLAQVTLLVRRHDNNMTKEKGSGVQGVLRVFKKVLDRKRAMAGE